MEPHRLDSHDSRERADPDCDRGATRAIATGGATYADIEGAAEEPQQPLEHPARPGYASSPSSSSVQRRRALWVDSRAPGIIAAEAGCDEVAEAIPIIGEAIAIIAVVADVASLAEVAAETGTSPWVIENEVNLTYQAHITINYDEAAASAWPATASTWTLKALIDGAIMP